MHLPFALSGQKPESKLSGGRGAVGRARRRSAWPELLRECLLTAVREKRAAKGEVETEPTGEFCPPWAAGSEPIARPHAERVGSLETVACVGCPGVFSGHGRVTRARKALSSGIGPTHPKVYLGLLVKAAGKARPAHCPRSATLGPRKRPCPAAPLRQRQRDPSRALPSLGRSVRTPAGRRAAAYPPGSQGERARCSSSPVVGTRNAAP